MPKKKSVKKPSPPKYDVLDKIIALMLLRAAYKVKTSPEQLAKWIKTIQSDKIFTKAMVNNPELAPILRIVKALRT